MGDILSVFSESIPSSSSSSTASMDLSNSLISSQAKDTTTHPHVPDSEPTDPPPAATSQTPRTLENPIEENPAVEKVSDEPNQGGDDAGGEADEEEEEGECGFCLFMKGGGCKDTFVEWEKCVEEGEKNNEDIVEKCFEVTAALKKCMEAHSDYYAPLLQAEKAAEEEAVKQLEIKKEKERLNDQEKKGEVQELGDNGKGEALGEGEGNK